MPRLGNYLGREVEAVDFSSLDEVTVQRPQETLALLWVARSSWREPELENCFERLARASVLGITVSGYRAKQSFDLLIGVVSRLAELPHIMTSMMDDIDVGNVLSEFLIASLPDTDRFNDWRSYSVCTVAPHDQRSGLREALQIEFKRFLSEGAFRYGGRGESGSE